MTCTWFMKLGALVGLAGTLLPVAWSEIVQAQSTVPQVVRSCETSGYGTFCGTWTWNGQYYDASWDNGATAKLMVERFDEDMVVITREDDSGASIGLTARYQGTPNDNQIEEGIVTGRWHWNTGRMHTQTWTWNANW